MIKELKLSNSENVILIDEDIYNWISKYDWQEVKFKRKDHAKARILIKKSKERIYLHNFIYPQFKHLLFVQLDENPYNYCRDNVEFRTYYREYIYREKEYNYNDKLKPGGLYEEIKNGAIIRSSEVVIRDEICLWCAVLDYKNWYKHCLDIAAKKNFKGWTFKKCDRGNEICSIIENNKEMNDYDLLKNLTERFKNE